MDQKNNEERKRARIEQRGGKKEQPGDNISDNCGGSSAIPGLILQQPTASYHQPGS